MGTARCTSHDASSRPTFCRSGSTANSGKTPPLRLLYQTSRDLGLPESNFRQGPLAQRVGALLRRVCGRLGPAVPTEENEKSKNFSRLVSVLRKPFALGPCRQASAVKFVQSVVQPPAPEVGRHVPIAIYRLKYRAELECSKSGPKANSAFRLASRPEPFLCGCGWNERPPQTYIDFWQKVEVCLLLNSKTFI
jgi:hypothetical protein